MHVGFREQHQEWRIEMEKKEQQIRSSESLSLESRPIYRRPRDPNLFLCNKPPLKPLHRKSIYYIRRQRIKEQCFSAGAWGISSGTDIAPMKWELTRQAMTYCTEQNGSISQTASPTQCVGIWPTFTSRRFYFSVLTHLASAAKSSS